jgi:hypothetical protein
MKKYHQLSFGRQEISDSCFILEFQSAGLLMQAIKIFLADL